MEPLFIGKMAGNQPENWPRRTNRRFEFNKGRQGLHATPDTPAYQPLTPP